MSSLGHKVSSITSVPGALDDAEVVLDVDVALEEVDEVVNTELIIDEESCVAVDEDADEETLGVDEEVSDEREELELLTEVTPDCET